MHMYAYIDTVYMYIRMYKCMYICILLVIQALWARAEWLSRKSGHAYTDRWGVRQNTHAEIVGLAKTVLMEWGTRNGFDFRVWE